MTHRGFGLNLFFALASVLGIMPGAAAAPEAAPEIAVTFDDLPSHGPLPAGMTRTGIAQTFVDALKRHDAPPVYGFLNAAMLKWDPANAQALLIWREAGNLLGNHTFTHRDPDAGPAESFTDDVLADEPALQQYMPDADWHWLRLPFLREGATPEKRAAIAAFLAQHGYRLADVSVAFNDYEFNAPYARCLAKNDRAALQWLKTNYLTAAAEALDYGRLSARTAFGRDIKHVLLLHFGAFDALMFPAVLDLLKARQFRLVTLPEAQSDPVYAEYGAIGTAWGGLLPQRAMAAKNIAMPPAPDGESAKLAALCQ
jgi:peptidoglycan-N-acetylglucosamine deacetylase